MRMSARYLSAGLLGCTLLAACALQEPSPAAEVNSINLEERSSLETPQSDCPVLESSDWIAWINQMPGAGQPTLNISGKVVVPTGGYSLSVQMGPLDRSMPPSQRLILTATPPDGPALQALTTMDVREQFPAIVPSYRSIIIVCAKTTLAEINTVETVR